MLTSCGSGLAGGRFDVIEIEVGEAPLEVWLADEPAERRQGLSEIDELPAGIDGMLFVFPGPTTPSFHMREVFFPLDIWWFDSDMTLIGRTRMETCTGSPCPSYGSPGEIGWALETPAGKSDFASGTRLSIVEND